MISPHLFLFLFLFLFLVDVRSPLPEPSWALYQHRQARSHRPHPPHLFDACSPRPRVQPYPLCIRRMTQPETMPLFYASLCGFVGLAEHLIAAHSRRRYQGRFSCNSITCRLAVTWEVQGLALLSTLDSFLMCLHWKTTGITSFFGNCESKWCSVFRAFGEWSMGRTKRRTRPPIREGFAEWKSRDLKVRAQVILTLKDKPLKPPPAFYTEIYTYSAALITHQQMESTHLSDSMKSRNFTTYYNSDLSTQKR